MAIVSGRKLADLRKRVGIRQIYYAGNHGFEIKGPGKIIIHPKAQAAKPILRKIKNALKQALKNISGIIIEDKTYTLSVHYRMVKDSQMKRVKEIFAHTLQPYLKGKKVKITSGKKVFEIRPPVLWNKGQAVLWFLKKIAKKNKVTPVYIGDDTTDEDAFKALKKIGITLRVGKSKNSAALKVLRDVNGVYKYIASLAEIC